MFLSRRIKIGFYSDAFGYGGSELYMRVLLRSLDKERFEPIFFYHPHYSVKENLGDIEGVQFEALIPEKKNTGKNILIEGRPSHTNRQLISKVWQRLAPIDLKLAVSYLRRIQLYSQRLRWHNLDMIHINETSPTLDVMAWAAARAGVPVRILTLSLLPEIKRLTDRILSKRALELATDIVIKTKAVKKAWLDEFYLKEDKWHLIPNGINLAEYDYLNNNTVNLMEKFNVPKGSRVLGLVGRLHPMKGHRFLLDALPKILKRHSNAVLVFIGEGKEKDALIRHAKELGILNHVFFLGFQPNIQQFTSMFDIAFLPSVALETFGWVNLEAMACRKPVVASKFGGIPEVVEDGVTGILVPPGDSDALAEAAMRLLDDPQLARQMGEAGRRRVEKYFTEEILLKETTRLYEFSMEKQSALNSA